MPRQIERIENIADLIDLAPVGALVHDKTDTVYANRFLLQLLGYDDLAEILGKPVLDLVHPAFRPVVAERIRKVSIKLEMTEPYELLMLRRDGVAVDVQTSSFPVYYSGKEAVQVIVQDISRRKKAEREAALRGRELERMLEKANGILWRADPETFRFEFVSKQAENILGYPVSRWLNEPTFWTDHIHPDDRQWTYDYCVQQTKALEYHEFEYRMFAADGRIVWLRDCVSVEAENGRPKILYGLMTDITAMKRMERGLIESEMRYRTMAEHASDIIAKLTIAGRLSYVSPAAEKLLGFKASEIITRETFDLVHPEDAGRVQDAVGSFASEKPVTRFDFRCRTATGDYLWLEAAMTPIPEADLNPGEYLVILRDVTEKRKSEEKIRELSRKLIDITEKERADISRDLHESIGQNLVLLKLRLQRRMELLPEEEKNIIGEFFTPIDDVLSTTRDLARKLTPMHLETLGLSLSIEDLCDSLRKNRHYDIDIALDGMDETFPPETHIQVYRIVQEAVTQVVYRRDATRILLRFEKADSCWILTISDNGTSIEEARKKDCEIAKQIMIERAHAIGAEMKFTKNQFGTEVSLETHR